MHMFKSVSIYMLSVGRAHSLTTTKLSLRVEAGFSKECHQLVIEWETCEK